MHSHNIRVFENEREVVNSHKLYLYMHEPILVKRKKLWQIQDVIAVNVYLWCSSAVSVSHRCVRAVARWSQIASTCSRQTDGGTSAVWNAARVTLTWSQSSRASVNTETFTVRRTITGKINVYLDKLLYLTSKRDCYSPAPRWYYFIQGLLLRNNICQSRFLFNPHK